MFVMQCNICIFSISIVKFAFEPDESNVLVGVVICNYILYICVFSISIVKFASRPDESYVLVGVVKDLVLNPRSLTTGYIYTYLFRDGEKLEFVHKTSVEDMPGAIAPFQGRAVIGVGKFLRIYDMGKKKLLRKCENKVLLNISLVFA